MPKRTDLTSEIDGAFASRNLGQRHFSEIARSGNGNMLSDLSEDDLSDYSELEGVGEGLEELDLRDSAAVDGMGNLAAFGRFRAPRPGETPPFAPKPGMQWFRKRTLTPWRKPGGNRVAKVKWVQATPAKMNEMARQGQVDGMSGLGFTLGTGAMLSVGAGLGLGIVAWLLLRRKKG